MNQQHRPLRRSQSSVSQDDAFEACRQVVRAEDPDRYAAILFAPAAKRPYLFALYGFNCEIARIRETVSEALPGEIRQQWWREALSCKVQDAVNHPVASSLLMTMARFRLPPEPFLSLIEARGFDLYDDPMPTWLDLEGYCGETSSALIRLASIILAEGEDPGSAELCGHAGITYALTGLLRAFPIHARRQQCYIPHEVLISCGVSLDDIHSGRTSEGLLAALAHVRARSREHLAVLRDRVRSIPPAIAPAFYPVTLCAPLLAQMERPEYRPFETLVEISPLARFWHIALGRWKARRKR
ncbi:ERG9 Phytoene/squalene synthetase [Rhabdaerophilaceae bacterium]